MMGEFKSVPERMLLDKETIGAINFHCGDGADGQFGEYADGLLWVGTVTDDEGKEVYGLHLATAEYPEEGSTTLVEFTAPSDAGEVARLTAERDALQHRLTETDQRNDDLSSMLQHLVDNPYRFTDAYRERIAAALNSNGKTADQLRDHTKMIAARTPDPDFSLIGIVHTPPVEHDEP